MPACVYQRDRLEERTAALRDLRRRKGRDPTFSKDLFVASRAAVFGELVTLLGTDALLDETLRLKS